MILIFSIYHLIGLRKCTGEFQVALRLSKSKKPEKNSGTILNHFTG